MRFPQFTDQPNAYAEVARQLMYLLLGFEIVHWKPEQQALVLSFVSAALAIFVWRSVVPTATIQEAGHSVTQIKEAAAAQQKIAAADRTGTGDGTVPKP